MGDTQEKLNISSFIVHSCHYLLQSQQNTQIVISLFNRTVLQQNPTISEQNDVKKCKKISTIFCFIDF